MLAKQSLYLIQLHTLWKNEFLFACLFFSFAMCFRFLFSTSPNLPFPKIVPVSFINRNIEVPFLVVSRWSCKAEVQAQNCPRSSFTLPCSQFLPHLYSKIVLTTWLKVLLSLERRMNSHSVLQLCFPMIKLIHYDLYRKAASESGLC